MTITSMNKVAYEAIMGNAQKSVTGRKNAVIPPEMIFADEMYQRIERRSEKKLNRLRKEWDYCLMDALLVVPHPETYNFYVVDGLGRLTVAKEIGLAGIDCVIIDGPKDPAERKIFEAKYFIRQAICTDPLRLIDMHNALVLIGDPVATAIDNICREYGVEITEGQGHRGVKKLGSYDRTSKLVRHNGIDALRWVFDVIKYAGFDKETNGYSGRLVTVLGKFYDGYKGIDAKELGEDLRHLSPMIFQANAVSSYPMRAHNSEIPMILYLQDWATQKYGVDAIFDEDGKRIKNIA